jgi:hypothetical protein
LVDALASGASGLTAVKVRVLSWAPFAHAQKLPAYGRLKRSRFQAAPGLPKAQFVLGEEKRGWAFIAVATLMFVARPRERRAQVVIAGAGDHETEIGMHVVAKGVIQVAARRSDWARRRRIWGQIFVPDASVWAVACSPREQNHDQRGRNSMHGNGGGLPLQRCERAKCPALASGAGQVQRRSSLGGMRALHFECHPATAQVLNACLTPSRWRHHTNDPR